MSPPKTPEIVTTGAAKVLAPREVSVGDRLPYAETQAYVRAILGRLASVSLPRTGAE